MPDRDINTTTRIVVRFATRVILSVSPMLFLAATAAAQGTTPTYYVPATTPATTAATQPVAAAPATQPVQQVSYTYVQQAAQAVQAVAADPYGFTAWLNATRAAYGLGPVGYDANLSAWANANNAQQSARGIGHFVMGPARRQNSAMGNYASIGAMWMASPAHRAALLDPTITMIGIAGWGAYWTFNAY